MELIGKHFEIYVTRRAEPNNVQILQTARKGIACLVKLEALHIQGKRSILNTRNDGEVESLMRFFPFPIPYNFDYRNNYLRYS